MRIHLLSRRQETERAEWLICLILPNDSIAISLKRKAAKMKRRQGRQMMNFPCALASWRLGVKLKVARRPNAWIDQTCALRRSTSQSDQIPVNPTCSGPMANCYLPRKFAVIRGNSRLNRQKFKDKTEKMMMREQQERQFQNIGIRPQSKPIRLMACFYFPGKFAVIRA